MAKSKLLEQVRQEIRLRGFGLPVSIGIQAKEPANARAAKEHKRLESAIPADRVALPNLRP